MLLRTLYFLVPLHCVLSFGTGNGIFPAGSDGGIPVPFNPPLNNAFISAPSIGSLPQQNTLPVSDNGQTWVAPAVSTDFQLRCKSWPSPVQDFVSKVVQNVNSDSALKGAFALDGLDADRAAEIYRDAIKKSHQNAGTAPDVAHSSSQLVYQTMKESFPDMMRDPDRHVRKLANLLGKYLYLRGRLSPENVDNFVQQLLGEYHKSVQNYTISDPTGQLNPENRIRALEEGIVNFLTSHGLYTAGSVWMLPVLFVDE